MKNQIDDLLASALTRWVDAVDRHARPIVIALLVVTLGLLGYATQKLRINSDNLRLVGEDFPERVYHEEFGKLFPNLDNAMLVVIDAETSELAREATEALSQRLRADTPHFTNVYLPGGGVFFERHGLR